MDAEQKKEFEPISRRVDISLRVIVKEDNIFFITLKRNADDTLMDVAAELAEMLNENKYELTFFF